MTAVQHALGPIIRDLEAIMHHSLIQRLSPGQSIPQLFVNWAIA
jgi:hypothetical protein